MTYDLYKLVFPGALHIGNDSGRDNLASSGSTIHSDTLFSALAVEAVRSGGERMSLVVELFQSGRAVLSDALPFRGEEYFLPKPARRQRGNQLADPQDRKLLKKLDYLPLTQFDDYLRASETHPFDIRLAVERQADLLFTEKRSCAAVAGQPVTQPFAVGSVTFNDGCGLYLIAGTADTAAVELLHGLLEDLSRSGIGGKRSVGYGRFELVGPFPIDGAGSPALRRFHAMLTAERAPYYMTLNTSLPDDAELDAALAGASFRLCRRGGFVQSARYADTPMKRKTVYALAAGACVSRKYRGAFLDTAAGGGHPVYRCLKPLFMGGAL